MKPICSLFIAFLVLVINCTTTLSQAPAQAPAQPPAQVPTQSPALSPAQVSTSPGLPNISAILEKAGHYTTFIRLLKSTRMDMQITKQLNNTIYGATVFVPTDNAFNHLKSGSLNTYSDQKKDELIQFHVIPSFFSLSLFETASNPLNTQAGSGGKFMMNVTTEGKQLKLSTGVVNASVIDTIYSANQLAVYQVDKVLFPLDFVSSSSPAPAPKKPKESGGSSSISSSSSTTDTSTTAPSPDSSSSSTSVYVAPVDTSGATLLINQGLDFVFVAVSCFSAMFVCVF